MDEDDRRKEETGSEEEGTIGGSGRATMEPSYARGSSTQGVPPLARDPMGEHEEAETVAHPPENYFMPGPPSRLSHDGHKCENGYTIVLWEDGVYYLYDDDGNLVKGEYFYDQGEAILRAEDLKPTPLRM